MYLQFYSIMGRKCLQMLKLALLGRNYFDPNMAVSLPNYKLQIWPGFLTTLRIHDRGLLYCVQTLSKVIRTEDVWMIMNGRRRDVTGSGGDMNRVKQVLRDELVGTIVLTHYGEKARTYRIDDIDWNERPTSDKHF